MIAPVLRLRRPARTPRSSPCRALGAARQRAGTLHARAAVHRHARSPPSSAHVSAYVSIRQHTSACVSMRQYTSAYVSVRQHTSAYASTRQHTCCASAKLECAEKRTLTCRMRAYVIRQHTSAYVSIRQHTSGAPAPVWRPIASRRRETRAALPRPRALLPCRLHTSAYVSIRQHTSAYVSIRQHTSAYVSIRQHTSSPRPHRLVLEAA